jgi:hypothetical protein
MGFPPTRARAASRVGWRDGCCVCVRVRNRNGSRDDVVCWASRTELERNRAWTGHDSSHGEMLAPALLTGSAVPIVTIRAVLWCARGDGFLCVGAEELWDIESELIVRSQREEGQEGQEGGKTKKRGTEKNAWRLRQCGVERRQWGSMNWKKEKSVKFERRTEMRLKGVLG